MIEINKCKLTPGITAAWGDITWSIERQSDLVEYISAHGGGQAVWGSITGDLTDQDDLMSYLGVFATQAWVSSQNYLTSTALSGYATESWVSSQNYLTSTALSGYATESWVSSQGYLTEHQDLSSYATQSWVSSQNYLTSTALTGYATESWVSSQGYLVSSDLSQYATRQWVTGRGYLSSSDLDGYATESWVAENYNLGDYATIDWITEQNYYAFQPGTSPVFMQDTQPEYGFPEDYPVPVFVATMDPIGYFDGEDNSFTGIQLSGTVAGIYTVTPDEFEGEPVYVEDYKAFAFDSDLDSLASRVSSLETNYGDAITITNNILG